MLSLTSRDCAPPRARDGFFVGLVACLCFGCPGVEPSTGAGGEGGDSSLTSSAGGEATGGGGATLTGPDTGGMGGMGFGGMGGCEADLETDVKNCGECGRKCVDNDTVALPRCIDGVCQSFCESGFVNITPDTGEDDGCEAEGRRVFVTDDVFTVPEVESVSNADTLCQMLAEEALLGGAWRAWLSDAEESSSPSARFNTIPDAPYLLLDFTMVAPSWAALIGGDGVMLDHPIDFTETMTQANDENVWTGTTPLGLPSGSHCSLWTETGKVAEATVGGLSQLTAEWTEADALAPCDGVGRLYCFEQ